MNLFIFIASSPPAIELVYLMRLQQLQFVDVAVPTNMTTNHTQFVLISTRCPNESFSKTFSKFSRNEEKEKKRRRKTTKTKMTTCFNCQTTKQQRARRKMERDESQRDWRRIAGASEKCSLRKQSTKRQTPDDDVTFHVQPRYVHTQMHSAHCLHLHPTASTRSPNERN